MNEGSVMFTHDTPPPFQRQRKHVRYELEFPVAIRCLVEGEVRELVTKSRNISLGGLLVEADEVVPWNCDVEFEMVVHTDPVRPGLRLRGAGHIVRIEPSAEGNNFLLALQCEGPMRRVLDEIRRAAA
jgi:hypothetical protein